MSDLSLDNVSVLLIWTAIAIYALAFVAYTVDLSRRGAQAVQAQDARERELVGVGASGRESIDAVRVSQDRAATALAARGAKRDRPLWARIGTSLTWLGLVFHVGADVTRGIAAGRVPWSNMYEFSMTGTMLIIAVYLAVLFRYDLRFLGAFVTGLIVVLLGGSSLLWVEVTPLSDPLKSVWLVIHVFVASLATALYALAFALSVLQLLQTRREHRAINAAPDAAPARVRLRFLRILPSSEALESLAYRFAIIGFIFWTFTLIAGSIWANSAWGRYWGFDTKEVWTFVIWVLYAGYIHARATRGWRGTRSAWLSIIGFAAVMFNFTIVNLFFKGLHVYSGIE
ncbi:MAG: c-type cytochrome biogenesis protein CcsB [Microbacterium sp.]|uniref:c-type cytochrome biogenesis protein CcsB n=1 Tax=Microbacterium sp. TaxID=51671 RepID=UPI0039E3FE46